jgi:DNA-binding NtrC family response regulator
LTLEDLSSLAQAALPLGRALESNLLYARLQKDDFMEGIVGQAELTEKLRQTLQRVAGTHSPVLLTGPTGSGKKFMARLIHRHSLRQCERLVEVDAASLSEDLAASELFGHVKGAFTGADSDRLGAFVRADRGTLLLSHVEELSPKNQALLLRVLETGKLRPVGASEEREVDVRVIATADTSLSEKIESGDFRRDLFFRLQVLSVVVPSLEERMEDLREIALYFVRSLSEKLSRPLPRFENGFFEVLMQQSWPGNFRQLRNTLERILVMSETDLIRKVSLEKDGEKEESFLLEDVIQEHIRKVLKFVQGNKSQAASLLGIDRSTLYARLKQMEKST